MLNRVQRRKEMSEDTNQTKKEKKTPQNAEEILRKKTQTTQEEKDAKKFHKVESKSIQNKMIDNIKNFISKIIEMQEKVRRDEAEEKALKKAEKRENKEKIENEAPQYLLEYYDLPFRYNETVIKILAQTPRRLFVYWDVADKDKQTYLNAFGEHFFHDTYPVLLVHNENKNTTFEIPINDFANSWYLDISNPRDRYTIQLGRKFKAHIRPEINPKIEETNIALRNDYLLIAMSNQLEVPNDHILFEEFKPYVLYRNVKNHQEETRKIETCLYPDHLKNWYKENYHGEIEGEKFDLKNPSSVGTSSSIAK